MSTTTIRIPLELKDRVIAAVIEALERNPRLGRPPRSHDRELEIGRRSRGYPAMYRNMEAIDTVFVLAVRGQGERGCARR